jgi:hypothetical protein
VALCSVLRARAACVCGRVGPRRLWSGGAGSPIRLTALPQCSSDGRPAPPSPRSLALPASRRPRRARGSGIGRRRWSTSRRPAWFCLMPRPRCRWPQMLGHRPSALVVRGQALAGRLHRSLPGAGRAPPTGGDRCPGVGLSRRVAKYAPHKVHFSSFARRRAALRGAGHRGVQSLRRAVTLGVSSVANRRARRGRRGREGKADASQSRDGCGARRVFRRSPRTRTTARAPGRLLLRFPSMPNAAQRRHAPGRRTRRPGR